MKIDSLSAVAMVVLLASGALFIQVFAADPIARTVVTVGLGLGCLAVLFVNPDMRRLAGIGLALALVVSISVAGLMQFPLKRTSIPALAFGGGSVVTAALLDSELLLVPLGAMAIGDFLLAADDSDAERIRTKPDNRAAEWDRRFGQRSQEDDWGQQQSRHQVLNHGQHVEQPRQQAASVVSHAVDNRVDHAPAPRPVLATPRERSARERPGPATKGAGRAAPAREFRQIDPPSKWQRSRDYGPPNALIGLPPSHAHDGFEVDGFVVRGASHVGIQHLADKKVRQDAYAFDTTEDGRFLILVVADGVSESSHSSVGASFAASTAAMEAAGIHSWPPDPEAAIRFASKHLVSLSGYLGLDPQDDHRQSANLSDPPKRGVHLATTIVVAAIDMHTGTTELARVGDSSAHVRRQGWLDCFPTTQFADRDLGDRGTPAIPHPAPHIELATVNLEAGGCLILSTDGVGDYLSEGEVGEVFHRELRKPPSKADFSALVGFERLQALDDQTALAVWRRDPATMAG